MTIAPARQFKQLSRLHLKIFFQSFLSFIIPFTGRHDANKLTCSCVSGFTARLIRVLQRHRRGHGFKSRSSH